MLRTMEFRGPDGEGMAEVSLPGWNLSLGHRRLSIIDLAGGTQPMSHNGHWITFNGEIYNYLSLRSELQKAGVEFSTTSDTEVLLKWLIHKGEAGIQDLDGMFSFGWWNPKESCFLLARDRMGVKPLYYYHSAQGLSFSSNLESLRKDSRVPFQVSPSSLQTFFFVGYSGRKESILSHVQKVVPGNYIKWTTNGKIEEKTYWKYQTQFQESVEEEEWLERLEKTLSLAVENSLASDVPLGLFLSGGTDSTLLAHYAKKQSKSNLTAFHISFEEKSFDESSYAKAVAKHFGIPFEMETLSKEELLQNIDSALDSLDEPISDHSMLPTYFLCKMAAKRGKVFLGGDGGDELFGGYASYKVLPAAKLLDTLPSSIRTHLLQPLVNALPSSDQYLSFEWKAKRFLNRWNLDARVRHLGWMGIADPSMANLAVKNAESSLPIESFVKSLDQDYSLGMLVDIHTYLPEYVLTKLDKASMKCSLEVRPPLLSNAVVELSSQIPSRWKVRGGETKYLLKKLAAKHLPAPLVYRPKQGFSVPLTLWTRTTLSQRVNRIFENSPVWDSGLERSHWTTFWQQHQNRKGNYSNIIWALVVYDHWLRKNS